MNKLLGKLKSTVYERNEPPLSAGIDEALEAYKDELVARWQEFVHRARVHEMLKCLESEHKRLQVLRDNIDFEELLTEHDAIRRSQEDGDGGGGGGGRVIDEEYEVAPHPPNSMYESAGRIRKSLAGVGQRKTALAIEIFKSKNIISDQEFENILELCDDKMEQQALREAFEEKKNRDKYLHNASEQRQMLYDFINSQFFVQFMLVIIIISICGIFLLTFEHISAHFSFPLMIMDSCIIAIFVVEASFKIAIYKVDYFKEVWNLLDMLIIVVHLLEVTVDLITKTLALSTEISSNIAFKFLKSLRALRLLRIIKFLPNLQVVLSTIFQSMLSMGSIAVLMILFIFVFAVMGRGLFYENSPEHFGSIWKAFITLFQLLTLDDWFELLSPVKHNASNPSIDSDSQYWIMFLYLFCYIVIEYFVFLNLFVAVLVDNFQLTLANAEIQRKKEELLFLEEQQKFDEIEKLLQRGGGGEGGHDELKDNAESHPDRGELNVEDYFPVSKGSRDAELYTNIFKDLNSLDFERFIWKRRVTLLNDVMDQALSAQQNTWTNQDAESLDDRNAMDAMDEANKIGQEDTDTPKLPEKTKSAKSNKSS